jgi:hypothetical protein
VTTRVDKDVVDAVVWKILMDVISDNIKDSEAFAGALKELGF